MTNRLEKFKKLKDKSLRVPWLGKLFDFSKTRRLFHVPHATPGVSVHRRGITGVLQSFPYKPDILCILLVIGMAFLFAGKPVIDLNSPPSASDTALAVKHAETGKEGHGLAKKIEQLQEIKARNIFAATGIYADTDAANRPLPDKPYTLIGVLYGKEMKAVFAEYTGAVVTMTVGKKMIDGFVITKIGSTSVKLKRGEEGKELRTFNVLDRENTIAKKMTDGSVIIINTGSVPEKLGGSAAEEKRERRAVDVSPRGTTAGQKTGDRSVQERTSGKLRKADDEVDAQEERKGRERNGPMRQQPSPRKP